MLRYFWNKYFLKVYRFKNIFVILKRELLITWVFIYSFSEKVPVAEWKKLGQH